MAKRKTTRRKSAQQSRSTLAPIVKRLRQELAKPAETPNQFERIARLMERLHAARATEKDKLLEKDRIVIDLVAVLQRRIQGAIAAQQITGIEFMLFWRIAVILDRIEDVLWELKGNKGPRPKPRPL